MNKQSAFRKHIYKDDIIRPTDICSRVLKGLHLFVRMATPFTLMATPFHIKGVAIPKGYFTLKYKLLKNIYLK